MMQKKYRYCDFCGKEIDESRYWAGLFIARYSVKQPNKDIDLCYRCADRVLTALNQIKEEVRRCGMNLIDRDALIEEFRNMEGYYALGEGQEPLAVKDIVEVINDADPVDATPVVHGEWIPTFHEYANKFERCMIADEFHCSQCGVYSKMKSHY